MSRIKILEDLIKHHQSAYYNDDTEISDDAYDALCDELRALDPDSQVLKVVGAPVSKNWPEVKHLEIVGSLHKAMDVIELRDWARIRKIKGTLSLSDKTSGIVTGKQIERAHV